MTPVIHRYEALPAAYNDYDAGAIDVARTVKILIEAAAPGTHVEHIGSTAIPGCAGKGIVDLMVVYPHGRIVATRDAIDGLGFQRQQAGHAFPEERPMRVGAIDAHGKRYRLHVHVIDAEDDEVASMRTFRDVLSGNRQLRADYEAKKRAILDAGLRESVKYTEAKAQFINALMTRVAAGEALG